MVLNENLPQPRIRTPNLQALSAKVVSNGHCVREGVAKSAAGILPMH